jgi:PAS domain S-box-containing protein
LLSSIAATLVSGSPEAILLADEAGQCLDANPAALSLLGYTLEDLLRLNFRDLVAQEPAQEDNVAGEDDWLNTCQGEIKLRASDGRFLSVEARTLKIPGPNGNVVACFLRDLTRERRLETELRAAEAPFRSLVEQLPFVVVRSALDVTQSTIDISPNCEAIFGYPPAEYITDPRFWIKTLHPEDRGRVLANLARMHETGEPVQDEYRMIASDGRVLWILEDSTLVRDEHGQPLYWQTVQLDITARKVAEEAQRQSEAHFQTAFAHAAIGMALLDTDGRVLQVNAALCELTGYTEEELLARSVEDITHPDDIETDVEHFSQVLAGNIATYHMEKRYLRKTGEIIWGHLSGAVVRDADGTPLHFISQIEDITARKQAEENLQAALEATQAANRAKGFFLDMMSHELRTPLQAVLGYAESLLMQSPDALTAEQREDIEYIYQGGGRMLTLINQMLDLSRMEAGRLELAEEAVDLAQVLEAVRQDIAPQAASKGLALEIQLPPALPSAIGDEERVRQILLNLAGNAVKFTDEGGVTIGAAATTAGEVEVLVRDTGVGIPEKDLPHIFEDFRQVDTRLSRRHGGAGLGLAIARRLAEQMGGRIEVSSEPGVGSSFRLYLPAT